MISELTGMYLKRRMGWMLYICLFVVVASVGVIMMPDHTKASENLIDVDFENWSVGGYTQTRFEEDWGDIWSHGIDSGRVTVVDDGSNGKAIKVKYPEGQISSANSGGTWMPSIGEHDEVYLSFKAFFPSDFDPVLMGKMHGLCGKDCPAGGSPVTGSNGFSARLAFTTWPNIELYLYHMHMTGVYGDEFPLDFDLVKNEWIAFKMRVKLNDIGYTNGEIQIWANDEDVLHLQNLELRTDPSVKIDTFDFSTFYGGATDEFKPSKDEYIHFDDFKVYLEEEEDSSCDQLAPSSGVWLNCGYTNQTDSFTVEFDSTPSANLMDGVVGLSDGTASGYADLATNLRFNNSGFIDARNGSSYDADATIAYSANTSYHFRMEVDMTNNEYSLYVTPEGGSEQTLAEDYAFRTEQASVTELNNISSKVNNGFGTLETINFTIVTETDTIAPTAPSNLSSPSKTATTVDLTWTASTDNVGVTGYEIYNGANLAGTTSATTFQVTGLTAETAYTFTVKAKDAANNVSAASNALNVTTDESTTGTIIREYWTGVTGGSVSNIPLQTTPSGTSVLTSLEGPTNWAESYGSRIRGYIHPTTTGSYTFWIAGDDNSELWLSTDSDPDNKVLIASVATWTNSREWNKFTSQQSQSISLTAGQKYYIEVLQKENTGGDNIAVGWTGPGIATTTVIAGSYLSPYVSDPGGTPAQISISSGDVTASSNDGNVPGNTVDGNLSTRWSASGDGQWIQFDMGASYTVSSIKMAFYNGDVRTFTFDIQVGNGTNWTTVATNETSVMNNNLQTFTFNDTAGSHVRIIGHMNSESSWNSYTEVEVWGY